MAVLTRWCRGRAGQDLDFGLAKVEKRAFDDSLTTDRGMPWARRCTWRQSSAVALPRSTARSMSMHSASCCTSFRRKTAILALDHGEILAMHMRDPVPQIQKIDPGLPKDLCTLIHKMLSKEAEQRPTMVEVSGELQRLQAELSGALAQSNTQQVASTGLASRGLILSLIVLLAARCIGVPVLDAQVGGWRYASSRVARSRKARLRRASSGPGPAGSAAAGRVLLRLALAPRQIGKSSLRVRTAKLLQSRGVRCISVDLTKIGSQEPNPTRGFMRWRRKWRCSFALPGDPGSSGSSTSTPRPRTASRCSCDWKCWPRRRAEWSLFIDGSIACYRCRLAATTFSPRSAPSTTIALEDATLERLTFCLLGSLHRADLIQNPTRTPFNIGRSAAGNFSPRKPRPSWPVGRGGRRSAAAAERSPGLDRWPPLHDAADLRSADAQSQLSLLKRARAAHRRRDLPA